MSRAKIQAQNAHNSQQSSNHSSSSAGFATGFLLGQLTLAAILFFFIKFFIFGEGPHADTRAAQRAAARRQRTLSHSRQRALSTSLSLTPNTAVLKPRPEGGLTVQKILEKTYYNVNGHQPESLDWFNVLIAQTISQLRADAIEDGALLNSLTQALNGSHKPDFLDEIRVTEINLGEEFPIFSNCRVIPVDEQGMPIKELRGDRGERLQARMDVDLGDVVTLGIETKLVLNYPKPFVAALPVALSVSVVRFSGTLSLSFSPSSHPTPPPPPPPPPTRSDRPNVIPAETPAAKHSPTTLTFTFLDDYRLDLSVRSLIGSRSKLQDVPKIAQLIEDGIHSWFDGRCVEPRFQQIVLPSLWPRKQNTRGGDESADAAQDTSALDDSILTEQPLSDGDDGEDDVITPKKPATTLQELSAEQRTRDWAARHGEAKASALVSSLGRLAVPKRPQQQQKSEQMSELERAGQEMREADEQDRRRAQQQKERSDRDWDGLRLRTNRADNG